VTEREMRRRLNAHLAENDAAPVVGCIGFGNRRNRSAMINVQPSDQESKKGDLIRVDVGGRTAVTCRAARRRAIPERRYAGIAWRSEEEVLRAYDIIKPGRRSPISIKEIVAAVQCKGVPHFEAPCYDLGFAGLQVEGMVRVTRDSAGSLMSLSTGLRIL
jgi:Xaa-Pro dipeptidase